MRRWEDHIKCNFKINNNDKPRPIHVALDRAAVTTTMSNCRLHLIIKCWAFIVELNNYELLKTTLIH